MATVKREYTREVTQCDKCKRFESDFFKVRHCLSNGSPIDLCESCLPFNEYCVKCGETENIVEMYNTGDYTWKLPNYYCKEHYQQVITAMLEALTELKKEYAIITQDYKKFS